MILYSKRSKTVHSNVIDEHIVHLVQNNKIYEQADLQKMLKERGFDIPQATLSRRLKKLKVAKIEGMYKIVELSTYHLPRVSNIQVSDFGMIVLHTSPGNANNLAYYLDQKYVAFNAKDSKDSGLLGTIAGDDTVLLIAKNKTALGQVLKTIQEEFSYMGL